ncbi:MAG: SUMF1/EgtB/PvdO family nonheme iron enzyme, partial [Chitinophagales bacterium]
HSHTPQDPAILYARALSHLYMDSLGLGLKDIGAVLAVNETYFQFNLAIFPLLQDLYLKTEGGLQEEVLKTLTDLGIDVEELRLIAEKERLKQAFGEKWKGVYLMSSKFDQDKKWRSFTKLVIESDGTVRLNKDTIQNTTYSALAENEYGLLQWSVDSTNTSSANLQLRRDAYANYKKIEWDFNKKGTNLFNFFELQNQIIDQQFAPLKGAAIKGELTLAEETVRQVRGWTFDVTPTSLQSFYKDDAPAPNFNKRDYAYVSEPNQYGLMRVQGEGGLWGMVNLKGQVLIPLYYEGIGIFSEGLAGVQKNKKIGFINPEGEVVISPQFDEVTLFKDGIATVIVDGKTFEINRKGNRLEEVVLKPTLPLSNEPLSPNTAQQQESVDIGQFEQMKLPEAQNTRQQLLAPAGMVYVAGGTFVMGNNEGEVDEQPAHRENVNDFYMDKDEVTNAQFANFLNEYKSREVKDGSYVGEELFKEVKGGAIYFSSGKYMVMKGKENYPVAYVTWFGANEYARFYGKRLPTEAEWEYAAKGGQNSSNYVYSGSNDANQVAWHQENTRGGTYAVGIKRANELGVYDMSGNVEEWCQDSYASNAYANSKTSTTNQKVLRGGSYRTYAAELRLSNRASKAPGDAAASVGFRCVKDFNSKVTY